MNPTNVEIVAEDFFRFLAMPRIHGQLIFVILLYSFLDLLNKSIPELRLNPIKKNAKTKNTSIITIVTTKFLLPY